MNECLVGYLIIMKSAPTFPGDKPPMAIGYKYRYHKVLGFIATEGARSSEPGVPYLYRFPENYSIILMFLFVLFFVLALLTGIPVPVM